MTAKTYFEPFILHPSRLFATAITSNNNLFFIAWPFSAFTAALLLFTCACAASSRYIPATQQGEGVVKKYHIRLTSAFHAISIKIYRS